MDLIKSWYEKFASQPHQPLFASGIVWLMLYLGLFISVYSGVLESSASVVELHAYSFIFVIFIQFFFGFLFVVFPKFLMQAAIKQESYMRIFWLYFVVSIGLFLSFLFSLSFLSYIFMAINFIVLVFGAKILYEIYKKSIVKDKNDSKWVLIGLSFGIFFSALFLISRIDFYFSILLEKVAIQGGFYLFLFIIFFTISQRMIPFFTSVKVPDYVICKSRFLMEKITILFVLKIILLLVDNPKLFIFSDLPLFLLFSYEFYRWKMPLFSVPAIVWVLFVSLYWIPLGFLYGVVESIGAIFFMPLLLEKSELHVFALGYFLTILVGFGTRVVLGHSGRPPHADGFAIAIFIAIQFIVMARLIAGIAVNIGLGYMFWIETSAILMIVGLMIWSARYLPILVGGYVGQR
ncbi:MAG: NnrS family protein [Wolinella sp.]